MLIGLIALYLLASIGIGLYAATRVHNTADYAVAGRSLPLAVVIATTFATWFGSETVLGVSARFVSGNLGAVVEDPFGASMCLVLVGLFFAYKLYQRNLITLGDYYRQRYGRTIEVVCSIMIMLSYLGWVAAQVTALGLVFHLLAPETISVTAGMFIGTSIVLVYTLFGGMWSVALTDFVQMIVIALGLLAIAWFAADLAGGAGKVIDYAAKEGKFQFFPEGGTKEWIFFFAAAITMMLGSIPQQDVFQRVMSSKDAKTAVRGPVIGGTLYFLFAMIPMFIVTAAVLVMGDEATALLKDDPQKVLPTLVMTKMPVILQMAFFGALLSAIMSTASATLLAPSTTFVENILRNIVPGMSDAATLKAMRITVLVFTALVLIYAYFMQGTSIYDLVSGAYQVPLVGAFVPLVFGLYWSRATTQGALLSVVLGLGTWLFFIATPPLAEAFPQQLAGLLAALGGMVVGSLAPQYLKDHKGHVHHFEGSGQGQPAA
jgi:SSS family solute:Na+ symporter